MYSTTTYAEKMAVEACKRSNLRVMAGVRDGGAYDLAVALKNDACAIVRCVNQPRLSDYTALRTMVADGDFVWAGLIYVEQPGADWPGHLEAFHVSEPLRLLDRLQALQKATGS